MTEPPLTDEAFGNGQRPKITAPDCQWIGTGEKPGFHGWPTLTNTGNDHLALVCSGNREGHMDPFGRVSLYESGDGGKSWSKPRFLTSGPLDDRDAGIVVTPAGTWLVNYFTSLAFTTCGDREGAQAHWKKVEDDITISLLRKEHGFFMLRSTDQGKTWSGKYRVPANNVHGPIVLHDGSLFFCGRAYYPRCMNTSCHANEIVCLRSEDDGLTWQEISHFYTGDFGEHQLRTWHELHSVETDSGKIITHIRCEDATWQMVSEDGGKSWQNLHRIAAGYPPHLLKLRDGRLLLSYGYRRPPYGNRCRISSDEGESWSDPIIISADGVENDLGYASTAELSDGTLVTAWYEALPDPDGKSTYPAAGRALLRCARWRFEA